MHKEFNIIKDNQFADFRDITFFFLDLCLLGDATSIR